jgi:hypothetical protein
VSAFYESCIFESKGTKVIYEIENKEFNCRTILFSIIGLRSMPFYAASVASLDECHSVPSNFCSILSALHTLDFYSEPCKKNKVIVVLLVLTLFIAALR